MREFPKNARVCFIGDSITHNNGYLSYISAFYHEHFKDRNINFYNCGVSGGRISTALSILDEDILSHNPTHAVIMAGINDSEICFLTEPRSTQRYDKLANAFEVYKKNLNELCDRLKKANAEIILCTQTPYDEYRTSEAEKWPGGYALMAGYADYIRQFAGHEGYELCDYHKYISRIMQDEIIINPDRVHPNDVGQFYMAKCFLAAQGFDIGEMTPLPRYMDEWREKVTICRNIRAAEHLIIERHDLPVEEGAKLIKEYIEEKEGDQETAHLVKLAKDYLGYKYRQKEIVKEINELMEKKFKE